MPRLLSRSLLSLLMVWQLLASVLAHPLPIDMNQPAGMDHAVVTGPMSDHMNSDDCPHQRAAAQVATHPADHADQKAPSCHAACKCPCAGTPALTFVLPVLPIAVTEQPLDSVDFQSLPFAPFASLLRPPIV